MDHIEEIHGKSYWFDWDEEAKEMEVFVSEARNVWRHLFDIRGIEMVGEAMAAALKYISDTTHETR